MHVKQSQLLFLLTVLFLGFSYLFFGCGESLLLYAGFSLVAVSRGYSLLWRVSFSLQWLLLMWSTSSRHTGLIVLWHVRFPQTKDLTSAPCIARQILNYLSTRGAFF